MGPVAIPSFYAIFAGLTFAYTLSKDLIFPESEEDKEAKREVVLRRTLMVDHNKAVLRFEASISAMIREPLRTVGFGEDRSSKKSHVASFFMGNKKALKKTQLEFAVHFAYFDMSFCRIKLIQFWFSDS